MRRAGGPRRSGEEERVGRREQAAMPAHSHDTEAESSCADPDVVVLSEEDESALPKRRVEPWRSTQGREHGRHSRSGGWDACEGFKVVEKHILPHIAVPFREDFRRGKEG